MAELKVELPKMGESVAEATITTWLKSVGDNIEEDEPIVEIATDKVDSEVPSPSSGILKEILFNEGEVVEVGAVFAVIETESNGVIDTPAEVISSNAEESIESEILKPLESLKDSELISNNGDKFYSPLVKSIAKQEGVSKEELNNVQGTGLSGRVTKKDILSFISNKTESKPINNPPKKETKKTPQPKSPAISIGGNDEVVEMDRMRKMIAEHMVMSVHTAPHVTSFVEADVTNLVLWRNKNKKQFEQKEGEKLTFTPIFIEAVAQALSAEATDLYPTIEASARPQ
jgi:2-oxoglutarate dehydrogenase E2 component (dihydrolipoamide succinyltransferase)